MECLETKSASARLAALHRDASSSAVNVPIGVLTLCAPRRIPVSPLRAIARVARTPGSLLADPARLARIREELG
jgi:hypothetical protein